MGILALDKLYELYVIAGKPGTIEGVPLLYTVAMAHVVGAQGNTYDSRSVSVEVPLLGTIVGKICFFVHLWHSGTVAVPVAVHANTAYATQHEVDLQGS